MKSKDVIFILIILIMPFVFPVINLTNETGWHDEGSLLHEYEEMSLNLADAGQDQLVFFDDFDDMNYDNWTVDSGTWDASEGYLASKGRSFHNPENSSEIIYEPAEIRRDLGENVSFNNMSLAFDFAFANSLYNENGTQDIQIRFWINESSLFTFNIVNIGNPVKDSFFEIRKIINGSDMLLYDLNFFPSDYCFHSVNITIIDNRITFIYDDTITFYKIIVPEFEEWTFSNFSIKLEGLDDTGCNRYRKFDNIKLMRISGINNEPQPISTSKFTKQTIFSDDFSDGDYDGWIVDSGTWGASEGYIRSKGCFYLGNLGTTFMNFPAEIRRPLSPLIPFNNISLQFDFRFENLFYSDGLSQDVKIKFWVDNNTLITLKYAQDEYNPENDAFVLQKDINGTITNLQKIRYIPDTQWHTINLTIVDSKITFNFDGETKFNQILIPEFETWNLSALSVKLSGHDYSDFDSYRNFDNFILIQYIRSTQPSAFIDQLVFYDDFVNGTYDDWIVDNGTWDASEGYLRSKGWLQFNHSDYPATVLENIAEIRRPLSPLIPFNNISLQFDFRFETPFFDDMHNQEIFIRFQINESSYFALSFVEDGLFYGNGSLKLIMRENGEDTIFADESFTTDNQWHTVNLEVIDNKVSVRYDGWIEIDQCEVLNLENGAFSAIAIRFGGWDDTVSDSYRNIDNVALYRYYNEPEPLPNEPESPEVPETPEEPESPEDPESTDGQDEYDYELPDLSEIDGYPTIFVLGVAAVSILIFLKKDRKNWL